MIYETFLQNNIWYYVIIELHISFRVNINRSNGKNHHKKQSLYRIIILLRIENFTTFGKNYRYGKVCS